MMVSLIVLMECNQPNSSNNTSDQNGSYESNSAMDNSNDGNQADNSSAESSGTESTSGSIAVTSTNVNYDANFNPIVDATVNNPTNKAITNIVFSGFFYIPDANQHDIFAHEFVDENLSVNISPNSIGQVTVSFSTPKEGMKYKGLYIKKIRFEDGSVEEHSL